MLTEKNDITKREEKLLEIMEQRYSLTELQLKELREDVSLQDDCIDFTLVMSQGEENGMQDEEVEKRLEHFKAKHARPMVISFRRKMWWGFAAIVAVALAFFVLVPLNNTLSSFFTPFQSSSLAVNDEKKLLGNENKDDMTVFESQDNANGVTMVTTSGTDAPLPVISQTRSNSVEVDFSDLEVAEAQDIRLDVPAGYDAAVTLPDGSIAHLHPGSRLKFPSRFIGDERQVILDGECYFLVKHDAAHPFVVSANNLQTTVLGTEFNISTNGSHGTVVTLVKGKVRVADPDNDASLVLAPGQQSYSNGKTLVSQFVDTYPFEAWRDGYLFFDNIPLADVMEAVGRNYNMTVHFCNRETMQMPVHFTCNRKASVDDAIALLNNLKKAHIERNGNVIKVKE